MWNFKKWLSFGISPMDKIKTIRYAIKSHSRKTLISYIIKFSNLILKFLEIQIPYQNQDNIQQK